MTLFDPSAVCTFSDTRSGLEALEHQKRRRIPWRETVAHPEWADELPGVPRQTAWAYRLSDTAKHTFWPLRATAVRSSSDATPQGAPNNRSPSTWCVEIGVVESAHLLIKTATVRHKTHELRHHSIGVDFELVLALLHNLHPHISSLNGPRSREVTPM